MRIALATLTVLLLAANVAARDLSRQVPIEIVVELGTKKGDLVFSPNSLTLETGKLYKLVLVNRSGAKHYFSSPDFSVAVWTRKLETKEVEVKGAVREIELKPGGSAAWFFVPVQAGSFELKCTIPGHGEAGMLGVLKIR